MMDEQLSPEQIKNWRKILSAQLGAYAFVMPESEIQQMRDNMQAHVDEVAEQMEEEQS